jgi:hypothetical protein
VARDLAEAISFMRAPDPNFTSRTRASKFSAAFLEIIEAKEERFNENSCKFKIRIDLGSGQDLEF